MLRFTYPATLIRDRKDGGYVVNCRDIPEAITQGDTPARGAKVTPIEKAVA